MNPYRISSVQKDFLENGLHHLQQNHLSLITRPASSYQHHFVPSSIEGSSSRTFSGSVQIRLSSQFEDYSCGFVRNSDAINFLHLAPQKEMDTAVMQACQNERHHWNFLEKTPDHSVAPTQIYLPHHGENGLLHRKTKIDDGKQEKKANENRGSIPTKGKWDLQEDRKLVKLVKQHGEKRWSRIAQAMAGRVGKQCRERWQNHLRPDLKKGEWTEEENVKLIEAHQQLGNKWTEIAERLPGRSENTIKNHWNATMRRQNVKGKCKNADSSTLKMYIHSVTGSAATNSQGSANNLSTVAVDRNVISESDHVQPESSDLSFEASVVPAANVPKNIKFSVFANLNKDMFVKHC